MMLNWISSLQFNTGGFYNTSVGQRTLYLNTTGSRNSAFGQNALYNNKTGGNNTAVGFMALFSSKSVSGNLAIGTGALYSDTSGNSNDALGIGALELNTSGSTNVAIGYDAMYNNTTGANNVANGFAAMQHNTTGYQNLAEGWFAMNNDTTGSFLTTVGNQADVNADGYYNSSAFGNSATITAIGQVRIGDNNVTSIGGYVNWTNISDGRVKKNIKQNVPGLAFINKLQPITYNLDLDAADKIIQRAAIKDKDGKTIQPTALETESRQIKEKILYTGFVAQDVEKAAKSLNYDFSGVDAAKNDKDLYGLRYSDFVVPLVKAVQELSLKNDSLERDNNNQKIINTDLETRLGKLEAMMSVSIQSTSVSSASLAQNIPNPFANATIISYTLPQSYSSAYAITLK